MQYILICIGRRKPLWEENKHSFHFFFRAAVKGQREHNCSVVCCCEKMMNCCQQSLFAPMLFRLLPRHQKMTIPRVHARAAVATGAFRLISSSAVRPVLGLTRMGGGIGAWSVSHATGPTSGHELASLSLLAGCRSRLPIACASSAHCSPTSPCRWRV